MVGSCNSSLLRGTNWTSIPFCGSKKCPPKIVLDLGSLANCVPLIREENYGQKIWAGFKRTNGCYLMTEALEEVGGDVGVELLTGQHR